MDKNDLQVNPTSDGGYNVKFKSLDAAKHICGALRSAGLPNDVITGIENGRAVSFVGPSTDSLSSPQSAGFRET